MSRAEIEAKKRYGISRGDDIEETSGVDMQRASDFIEGYHQAEKDLELTWEDIASILDTTDVIANDDSMEERLKTMSEEEYCQEVLRRFKSYKEGKEK